MSPLAVTDVTNAAAEDGTEVVSVVEFGVAGIVVPTDGDEVTEVATTTEDDEGEATLVAEDDEAAMGVLIVELEAVVGDVAEEGTIEEVVEMIETNEEDSMEDGSVDDALANGGVEVVDELVDADEPGTVLVGEDVKLLMNEFES